MGSCPASCPGEQVFRCFTAVFSMRSALCLSTTERGVRVRVGGFVCSAWSRGVRLRGHTAAEQIEPLGLWQRRGAEPPATHPCRLASVARLSAKKTLRGGL